MAAFSYGIPCTGKSSPGRRAMAEFRLGELSVGAESRLLRIEDKRASNADGRRGQSEYAIWRFSGSGSVRLVQRRTADGDNKYEGRAP